MTPPSPDAPRRRPPIDALPTELLAYILTLATHAPDAEPRPATVPDPEQEGGDMCTYQPFDAASVKRPLRYAGTCRRWRAVAFDTPLLWTNICVTPDMFVPGCPADGGDEVLDTRWLELYCRLSRNRALDILIDGRDMEWRHADPRCYTPWFTTNHMTHALSVLLPHLGRWRSISVLTDVYSPMHVALKALDTFLVAYGAPFLESIRLMRCDAYAAFSRDSPVSDPAQLFLASATNHSGLLPSLRHLTMRGVPACWSNVAAQLTDKLCSLEISHLPRPAQPTVTNFVALLSAAKNVSRLVMNGAGPSLQDVGQDFLDSAPIGPSLPLLSHVVLGIRKTAVGFALLHMLHGAPKMHHLTLEDASDPAERWSVDCAPLIAFLHLRPNGGLFPTLAELRLRRVRFGGPVPPGAHVPYLELISVEPNALDVQADEVCIRGPIQLPRRPLAMSIEDSCDMVQTTCLGKGDKAPRLVTVHEFEGPDGDGLREYRTFGSTEMRIVTRASRCTEWWEESSNAPSSDSEESEVGSSKLRRGSDPYKLDWPLELH
ncbi:unnamed protein product [Mycena citricolor]|uniref:F-box domain-containing protein n=1 Tax=Mycena citricolor TaxID=2018698 RepID=A0AAD2K1W0_9AGAR|nr:unnamed protein product [Mycena citricolor]